MLEPDDPRHGTLNGYKGLRCRCDLCHAAVSRRNGERYEEFKVFLAEAKDRPCADCGVRYPVVCMDFDHRDPSQKSFVIAEASQRSREAVVTEIAKCDVVCANCHRLRTVAQSAQGTITVLSQQAWSVAAWLTLGTPSRGGTGSRLPSRWIWSLYEEF